MTRQGVASLQILGTQGLRCGRGLRMEHCCGCYSSRLVARGDNCDRASQEGGRPPILGHFRGACVNGEIYEKGLVRAAPALNLFYIRAGRGASARGRLSYFPGQFSDLAAQASFGPANHLALRVACWAQTKRPRRADGETSVLFCVCVAGQSRQGNRPKGFNSGRREPVARAIRSYVRRASPSSRLPEHIRGRSWRATTSGLLRAGHLPRMYRRS